MVEIDTKDLGRTLAKFVAVGSIIHKLTPDEIQVIGNHKGNYANKEEKLVHDNGDHKVPDTIEGLMANGTKSFDAFIYMAMDPTVRPPCSPIELIEEKNGDFVPPTYGDIGKLTTYIFTVFFILIRAHPPADNGSYSGQTVPIFITNTLKVTEPIAEIVDYLASFDLIKLNPSWVHFVPMNKLSQEAVNRFGLGVAGYRIVSVFNIVTPDLYAEEPVPKGKIDIRKKPEYIDATVTVARSFVLAGYCWDFHPATRHPNVITKYGNTGGMLLKKK